MSKFRHSVQGTVEVDSSGDVLSANFPVFGLSEGTRPLKAERGNDGALRVSMRGDVYDGPRLRQVDDDRPGRQAAADKDIDLDLKSAPWWAIRRDAARPRSAGSRGAPASSRAWR